MVYLSAILDKTRLLCYPTLKLGVSCLTEPFTHKGETLEKKLIFIVDDEPLIRKVFTSILEDTTLYRIQDFPHPGALLEALEGGLEPDLILTDNDMPVMTGTQLVKHLREIGFKKPIIMCSGSNRPQNNPILRSQIDGFFTKPSPIQEIVDAVSIALAM